MQQKTESKLNFLLGNKGLLVDEGDSNSCYFTGERRTAITKLKLKNNKNLDEGMSPNPGFIRKHHKFEINS